MAETDRLTEEYRARVNKALDYIEQRLAEPLTLEDLAEAANFSKFHFNRLFHSIVGETPFRFVQRLRLQKAASMMVANRNLTVTDVAFACGFSDISVFSRNFRKHYNISATEYRKEKTRKSNISQINSNPGQQESRPSVYICPELNTVKWRTNMKQNKGVEVKVLPRITVAYVRNIGPYDGNRELFGELRDRLFAWAGARGLIGSGSDFNFIVCYHDDPNVALGDKLRMSLCITVPPDTPVSGEIGKMEIEAGSYAVARFEMRGEDFAAAWDWLYGRWMPASGYQPADGPYFEKFAGPPDDGNYIIDLCIPVKPL